MSGTLGDTRTIREDLEARTQRKVSEVRGVERPVPLDFTYSMTPLHEMIGKIVHGGKAPVYIVHFTQSAATEQAQALMSTDWCTKEEKRAISDAVKGFSFHSPFGPTVRRFVLHGVGLHHAGLLPRYRLLVERLAQKGLLKVICGTDTLGVGINVPIRTVLFTQLCKYNGDQVVILPVREFRQIAGRAGRAGYDSRGFVVVQAPAHIIENAKIRETDPKKARKIVKAQPPAKGYKPWDETTFQQLTERPPEPLTSQFQVDHGLLLTLMQHAEDTGGDAEQGYQALLALIESSHTPPKRKEELKLEAAALLANLEGAGVVWKIGARLELDRTLQRDFTLHHSLSLFLLDAIAGLPKEAPTHALDLITLVESILESPKAILARQIDRAKTARLMELKAAGVPYEERLEELEKVTHPKPNAEAIYAFFNEYVVKHPWLVAEAIRPKSIAREMAETFASFSEYVRDLGLQRVEGVLLRYLTEVYQALCRNVPLEDQSDDLLDRMAWMRAMLGQVDASLVTEWEDMLAGKDAPADAPPPKPDISADRRAFAARVRAELHSLVRALAAQDWEEAAAAIRPDDAMSWTPDDVARAIEPFLTEFGAVGFDHRARLAHNTVITSTGPHQWEVRQVLYPPHRAQVETYDVEGHEDDELDTGAWAITGRIDLRDDTNPQGPIVQVLTIGE
jgi:hypothetical protein